MEEQDLSMLLVYLMDRFVWMLLVTVFTTAVLQQCGVVATYEFKQSTTVPVVPDTFHFEMEPDHRVFDYAIRQKRQQQANDRSPVIDNIFNIPIATLSAVNDLIQTSRPGVQRIRDRIHQTFNAAASLYQSTPGSIPAYTNGYRNQRGTHLQQRPSRVSGGRYTAGL